MNVASAANTAGAVRDEVPSAANSASFRVRRRVALYMSGLFFQKGVEEAVMYGRQLGIRAPFSRFFRQKCQHAFIAGKQRNKTGIRRCCQKGLDLSGALFREDGARGIKHPPAWTEEGPERLEQPFLFGGQFFDVIGSA